jgi:hypothetical protein
MRGKPLADARGKAVQLSVERQGNCARQGQAEARGKTGRMPNARDDGGFATQGRWMREQRQG